MLTAYLIVSSMLVAVWCTSNIYVVVTYTAREMKEDFWDEQEVIGKVCANIFYMPAWLLKGIKFVVNLCIK